MSTARIIHAEVLDGLKLLKSKSVHCVVTSPPYWGLRDYGTAKWTDGDPDCDHVCNRGRQGAAGDRAARRHTARVIFKEQCSKCGAIRLDQQLGLEPTPQEYIRKMVKVFRAVRRVLRDDGTLWLNMGDCYATGAGGAGSTPGGGKQGKNWTGPATQPNRMRIRGLKSKDLVGMPWRLALALQRSGWYLRSDIIWHKTQPMPESMKDRPTKSHEYLFLLSKSETYYYDYEAIMEPCSPDTHARYGRANKAGYQAPGQVEHHGVCGERPNTNRVPAGWHQGTRPATPESAGYLSRKEESPRVHGNKPGRGDGGAACNKPRAGVNPKAAANEPGSKQNSSFSGAVADVVELRNKRSVWTLPTEKFSGNHFATYPRALVDPCILAGCPEGGTVLDCFVGSGTSGVVARMRNREFIGIDVNGKTCEMARKRIDGTTPMFHEQTEVVALPDPQLSLEISA
jgi:DNA modification methylase